MHSTSRRPCDAPDQARHHVNVPISNRERTREWYIKVLGAEFLDRGPALNKRQLQLRLGSSEIHFTETPHPTPSSHFALEIDDWDAMLSHLDELGIPHVRTSAASVSANLGGTLPDRGVREDTREHYTYLHDPDGNMIELVYHPLSIEDAQGNRVGGCATRTGSAGLEFPPPRRLTANNGRMKRSWPTRFLRRR